MGWLFKQGCSRKDLIHERTENWERTSNEMLVKTVCLAHCYRGGTFSGVLWGVWERTFTKDGLTIQPEERWITCDLLRYRKDFGWGYKDLEESMHPYFYSCPLGYLKQVPMDQYGGHAEWREGVQRYHALQAERRRKRVCPA
jgi:hypothetical protein